MNCSVKFFIGYITLFLSVTSRVSSQLQSSGEILNSNLKLHAKHIEIGQKKIKDQVQIIKIINSGSEQNFRYKRIIPNYLIRKYSSFDEYIKQYNKSYNQVQYELRKMIYQDKISTFSQINNFVPGVNNFTDWTQQEFQKLINYKLIPTQERIYSQLPQLKSQIPVQFDWRDKNIITKVKNQRQCGSCWAFTAVALVQSFLVQNQNQNLSISLSEQYALQCSGGGTCYGGYISKGIDGILKRCPSEQQYPYIAPSVYGELICSSKGIYTNATRQTFFGISDQDLINLLQDGPVAVAVKAREWQTYSQGIIECSSIGIVDHAVVAVGYTQDAIIIKNSWGQSWGMNGYAYISRDSTKNCKITTQVHQIVQNEDWSIISVFMLLIISIVLY